jgi:hypothetical protein
VPFSVASAEENPHLALPEQRSSHDFDIVAHREKSENSSKTYEFEKTHFFMEFLYSISAGTSRTLRIGLASAAEKFSPKNAAATTST